LLNPDPGTALDTGIKSLFGLSNLYLFKESTDYFAQSTELNPFTHTWSLGVEEQFYLLFPFLIWLSGFGRQAKNGARNLFLWIGALSVASLTGFIYLYQANQPAAYFLMPARFWEMAAGCLVFIGFQKRAKIEKALEQVSPLLVVALMVGVMFFPIDLAVPATIAIVALSTILLACLKDGTAAFAAFTHKKFVYLGLISYSLYLWHWGILSISRWSIGIHWWSTPLQVLLILAASIYSYKYLEIPFRSQAVYLNRALVISLGFILLFLSSASLSAASKRFADKLYLGRKEIVEVPHLSSGKELRNTCQKNNIDLNDAFRDCLLTKDGAKNTLWLLGDSHAEAMQLAADLASDRIGYNLFAFFYGATAFPPIKYYRTDDNDNLLKAYEMISSIQSEVEHRMSKGDVVLISMRMPYYFGRDSYEYPVRIFRYYNKEGGHETRISKEKYFEEWINKLGRFLSTAQAKGVKVVVFNGTPEFEKAKLKQCAEQNTYWFNRLRGSDCSIPRSHFIGRDGAYSTIQRKLSQLEESHSNLLIFDMFSLFCPGESCKYAVNGVPLYRDDDHISIHASKNLVAPSLADFLGRHGLLTP
jgi:peptidoglycan/LPS O-acetylase OafA/YrhL